MMGRDDKVFKFSGRCESIQNNVTYLKCRRVILLFDPKTKVGSNGVTVARMCSVNVCCSP